MSDDRILTPSEKLIRGGDRRIKELELEIERLHEVNRGLVRDVNTLTQENRSLAAEVERLRARLASLKDTFIGDEVALEAWFDKLDNEMAAKLEARDDYHKKQIDAAYANGYEQGRKSVNDRARRGLPQME